MPGSAVISVPFNSALTTWAGRRTPGAAGRCLLRASRTRRWQTAVNAAVNTAPAETSSPGRADTRTWRQNARPGRTGPAGYEARPCNYQRHNARRLSALVTRCDRSQTHCADASRDGRLTRTTNVSVDGVTQGLGGSDEDRRGGFERGGWAIPLLDTEAGDHINEVYGGAAAFLFGRRTYEIFAGSWGAIEEMRAQPIGVALNETPKYVASTSLTDPQWAGTTVLTGDVAAAVRDLKAQQDGELLVPGSGALVRWLLANDLVDQLVSEQPSDEGTAAG